MQPNEKMSERWSIGLPTVCSGDMEPAVPTSSPCPLVRLEVAVHDAGGVRLRQAVRGLREDLQPPRERGLPGEEVAQRLPFDELHGDVVQLLGPLLRGDRLHDVRRARLPDLVDGDDVRMVERGRGLRFLREAVDALAVVGDDGWQDFERDVAAEALVAGAVDVAHPAGGDESQDAIRADAGAARQRLPRLFRADVLVYDFSAAEDGAHSSPSCGVGSRTFITGEVEGRSCCLRVRAASCTKRHSSVRKAKAAASMSLWCHGRDFHSSNCTSRASFMSSKNASRSLPASSRSVKPTVISSLRWNERSSKFVEPTHDQTPSTMMTFWCSSVFWYSKMRAPRSRRSPK